MARRTKDGTANACYHVKRVFAVFHEPSIMIFALSAVSETISLSCVSFESLICAVSADVDRRDSECQLGLYDEVLCPVNVVYADNGLGIVVDRESEPFAAEH